MTKEEIRELIRAHLDAGVDIEIPDDEIRAACAESFAEIEDRLAKITRRVSLLETPLAATPPAKPTTPPPSAPLARFDAVRAAKTAKTTSRAKGRLAA